MNTFLDLIKSRHCKRAFLNKPIPQELLKQVLTAAQDAPSSKNTQSWKVAVVTGTKRDELSKALCKRFDAGDQGGSDYQYMMDPIDDVFMRRARACGYSLFELKGIDRKDKEARMKHSRENFSFFNAPVQMIFHLPKTSQSGMFLDMGFYMQNIMLGLKAIGLDSCPQYSVACYPDTIREQLSLGEDRLIVSGLSVGYADESAKVNSFIPKRLELDESVDWFDS